MQKAKENEMEKQLLLLLPWIHMTHWKQQRTLAGAKEETGAADWDSPTMNGQLLFADELAEMFLL
jgi:hypothetical protein